MSRQGRTHFVVAAPLLSAASAGAAVAQPHAAGDALTFRLASQGRPLPFAWVNGGRRAVGSVPPFARMTSIWDPPESADTLMKQLLSEDAVEQQQTAARRGHSDDWYMARCVFCADCRTTVNSHHPKRGSRCQGCRRWYHASCMPGTGPSGGSTAAAAAAEDASSEQQQQQHSDEATQGASQQRGAKRHASRLYFHSSDCQLLYDRLARVAAEGEQLLPAPPKPLWQRLAFWQPQAEEQAETWRLLDLADVRRLYKDAQRRGTLFKQHTRAVQQLQDAQDAAAERAASKKRGWFGSGSGGGVGAEAIAQAAGGAADSSTGSGGAQPSDWRRLRRGGTSALDDFLVVSEVLKPLGESPRDLLEDSFALITRLGRDGPTCAATFNVYGADHARLQGLATPEHARRQGHARRLLQQLQGLLADAGVGNMVVLLEPEATLKDERRVQERGLLPHDDGVALFRRHGFRPVGSEQKMLWRLELPEYHKGLVGTCSLLVKPLKAVSGSRR